MNTAAHVFVITDERLVKADVVKFQPSGNVKCTFQIPGCLKETKTFKPERYTFPGTKVAIGHNIKGKVYFSPIPVPQDEAFWGKNDVDFVEEYWKISGHN